MAVPRDREDRGGELRTGTPGAGVCLLDNRVSRWKGLSSACSDCRSMSPAANTTRDQASLLSRGMSQQSLEGNYYQIPEHQKVYSYYLVVRVGNWSGKLRSSNLCAVRTSFNDISQTQRAIFFMQ